VIPYNSPVRDIVIVGGGPAGLLAAARCAEAGLDVLVLEEHPRIGEPTHCTGIISMECADLVKIPDEVVLNRLTRARLIAPGGVHTEVQLGDEGKEQVLVIDRGEFDRRLAQDAATAGATVRTGVRADGLAVSASRAEVVVGGNRIGARLVLLTCGVSYALLRQVGLGLPARMIHTAQVEVPADPAERVELYFGSEIAPGGFVWTTPILREGKPSVKIGAMARGDVGAYLTAFLARPAIRQRLQAPPPPPVRRLLPLGPGPKTYTSRVLVAGDAGGLTKPTTGGGIFYSLLSASLAAQTAIEACQTERLEEGFLQRYERRWRRRLGPEFRVARWFRDILERCTDPEIDRLVRAVDAEDVQSVIHSTARFNWHRDLIVALAHQPGVLSSVLRSLLR
jgi:digeranylgeranylglycerophospholipid reductase